MNRLASYASVFPILFSTAATLSQDELDTSDADMQEMEQGFDALDDMLKGLSGLKKKLPDRSLYGTVRVLQDLDKQQGPSTIRGRCSAFTLLTLRSHSLESYPRGAWESKDGWVHVLVQRDRESTSQSGTETESWRADDFVHGSFAINTHDDGTYSVAFSSAAVDTRIEIRRPRSDVFISNQGRCYLDIDLHNLPMPQDEAAPFAGSGVDAVTNTRVSWEFWPNECKSDEHKISGSRWSGPVVQEGLEGKIQAAFVKAFQDRGVAAGPEHVTIFDPDENPSKFIIRVSQDHCLLPNGRAIAKECIRDHSQEGAKYAFIGGIQRSGLRTRVTVRVVDIETGECRR